MKCPRCEHDNPQGARFCEECASPLARTCSNCGTALSATAKFCHACARPVTAATSAPPPRSPESYTPKHPAERIINSKGPMEGEREITGGCAPAYPPVLFGRPGRQISQEEVRG